ncbi:hypothetical protein NE452_17705, partial [Paeniclostridium sordellii]|uniref:hypothetical protein n=1 Tax=Paraclostridium sordellii TaxID=1505 RepID=UPI00210CB199
QTNKDLEPIAEADKKLITGATGNTDVELKGEDWILGYAPEKNINNRGIGVMINKGDFLGQMYNSIFITVVLYILFIVVAFIVAAKFASMIGNPLKQWSERLKKL